MLRILYIADIATVLASSGALSQHYSDDIQAYLHCPASAALTAVATIEQVMVALTTWLSADRLSLIASKAQFI